MKRTFTIISLLILLFGVSFSMKAETAFFSVPLYENDPKQDPASTYISFVSAKEAEQDKTVTLTVRYDGEITIKGATGTLMNGVEGTLTLTGGPVTIEGDIYYFSAWDQRITDVDLSHAPGLVYLDLSLNELSEIDITALTELQELKLEYNQLSALDLTKNTRLTKVYCYVNNISELDLSNLKDLYLITCFANRLSSLDISPCKKLAKLSCDSNPLKEMDFSQNPELVNIWCASTEMTSIDVTKNTKLKQFICTNNDIAELDLSQNPDINLLYCAKNNLSELDITGKSDLRVLWLFANNIAEDAMQDVVDALPSCAAEEGAQFVVINTKSADEKNVCTAEQVAIAKGKQWSVIDLNSSGDDFSEAIEYEGSATDIEEIFFGISLEEREGFLQLSGLKPEDTLRLIRVTGENVMLSSANEDGVALLKTAILPKGLYLLLVNDRFYKKIIMD